MLGLFTLVTVVGKQVNNLWWYGVDGVRIGTRQVCHTNLTLKFPVFSWSTTHFLVIINNPMLWV